MASILIRGGVVIDGSGAPRVPADVLVDNQRIVAVGLLQGAQADMLLDARGCVVSPGFVDMHSHTDFTLPALPTADSLVQQGITTAVVGQCGASSAPLLPETRAEVTKHALSDEVRVPYEHWSTFGSYLDYLRALTISVNIVPLVGQGMIRDGVMGYASQAANEAQLARMRTEVAASLEDGAFGLSTGLIYPPGSYAPTEELIALARTVGKHQGHYYSHIRGEGDTLLEAVAEAIRIGREGGCPVEISHFKAAGRVNWSKAPQALELIDRARAEGLDVDADMYPYLAGSSSLVSMLPEWAQVGGAETTLKRLADPTTRGEMVRSMQATGFFRIAEWDGVLIAASPRNRAYEGHTVADLARDAHKSPYDWVFDALLETELRIQQICDYACEENLGTQLRCPWMMIGTDSSGRATQGPLSKGVPHPRTYGTFPRVLGRYVREQQVIPLEEAIHKMTGLAARKLRWSDRGLLKPGYVADLVVFDPHTVADLGTYQAPHQYPVGIRTVVVNGQVVVSAGAHTGGRPGRVLGR